MNETIFVSIASYKDFDVINTIDDIFNRACYKHRIVIGLFLQDSKEEIDRITKLLNTKQYYKNINLKSVIYTEAKGCGWARNVILSELYNNEDFFFCVDSHSRFLNNWDTEYISWFNNLPSKGVISVFPQLFEFDETYEEYTKRESTTIYSTNAPVWSAEYEHPPCQRVCYRDYEKNMTISGGNIFGSGKIVSILKVDKYYNPTKEQEIYSLLLYKSGYDIYAISKNIVWHKYIKSSSESYRELCNWSKFNPENDFVSSLKYFGGTERSYLMWLSEIYKECDDCYKKKIEEKNIPKTILHENNNLDYSNNLIHFYWDGDISENRLKILKDSIYSTRIYNKKHKIILHTNTLKQDMFDEKFNIEINNWNDSLFEDLPLTDDQIEKYKNLHPRDFSDLFRLIILWKYGGSYMDTDDICIHSISNKRNLICRSYDPHTSSYNNVKDEECIPGHTREIRGYDQINMFPRNDCWQNFEIKSKFITDLLFSSEFLNNENCLNILGENSWQSLVNKHCINKINEFGKTWNYGLTLLYLYEDFVSTSSIWDKGKNGGEMHDMYKNLPNIEKFEWGNYKCNRKDAYNFLRELLIKYPYLTHMWLHSKDQNEEWLIEDLDINKLYSISTWIYNKTKKMIKNYETI